MTRHEEKHLVDGAERGVSENCPSTHLPETDHADTTDDRAEGKVGRIPRTNLPGNIGEDQRDSEDRPDEADNTNDGDGNRANGRKRRW